MAVTEIASCVIGMTRERFGGKPIARCALKYF
jgi:hypothetical protein